MIIQTKEKQNKTKQQPFEKFPYNQHGDGQARHEQSPGGAERAHCVDKALEKKKEIVQYHPPRGKP